MSELVGTILQVAEALETTDDSIRWLKKNRGLPHVYINRKEWRVPWDALKEWLAAEVARNAAESSGCDDDHQRHPGRHQHGGEEHDRGDPPPAVLHGESSRNGHEWP